MSQPRSAGIVIVRKINDNTFNVLLMRAYNYWDFPKGGIEENETELQAALREVEEEAGITKLSFNWGEQFYTTEKYGKTKKTVTYFIAETTESNVVMGISPTLGRPEHNEYRWLSFDEARMLTIDRITKVLNWAENEITNAAYNNFLEATAEVDELWERKENESLRR